MFLLLNLLHDNIIFSISYACDIEIGYGVKTGSELVILSGLGNSRLQRVAGTLKNVC